MVIAYLGVTLVLLASMIPAASASNYGSVASCDTAHTVHRVGTLALPAFATRRLTFSYDICWTQRPIDFVGPIAKGGQVRYAADPVIRTPSSVPFGGFYESVEVVRGDWFGIATAPSYGFSLRQTVVRIFGAQEFNVNVSISEGAFRKTIRMCLGRTCTTRAL